MTGLDTPHASWVKMSGIDFGAGPGHAFAYIKVTQLPTGQWLVFHEYVAEQRLMMDHAKAIKGSPLYSMHDRIYCDWAAQDRLELRSHGIRAQPAVKDVPMGIDYLKELLSGYPPNEEPMLFVWHECRQLIKEFGLYSWRIDRNGMPDKSGLPEKTNDHALDALRYCLYSAKAMIKRRYSAKTIPGI